MTKRTTRKAAEAARHGGVLRPVHQGRGQTVHRLQQRDPGGAESGDPEKNKVLAALIVPLEDLPEAMRQLRQKSGRIHTLYKAVQGRT